MSVSMDNEPADNAAAARGDLATWLDNYTAGRCDRGQMQSSFLQICRSNPEAPWDALALLDQYQRRGRIDAGLARSLKSDIAQLVFGVVNQTEEYQDAEPEDETTTDSPDATGTRWRKLVVGEDNKPARPTEAFVDPIQFNRDIDPLTRPPPSPVRNPRGQGEPAERVLRDRYELLSIVERSAHGTIYKAIDRHRANLDPSARFVALRVFKSNYRVSPAALAALERQFHQAQSLSHPNIVNVFDLDRDGSTYFVTMEFLEGELLSDVLARLDHRPMHRDRALAIIGAIGSALAYAHRCGVVHGDLQPGNVMITSSGEVKVLDFGFGRREQGDAKRGEPWIGDATAEGSTQSATLAYASEDRGSVETPEEGEDVYSLGCMAYEMLSGQHPFGGRSGALAHAQGRSARRIPSLTRRQWSALRSALQWSHTNRKIDVGALVAALGCGEIQQHDIPPQEIVAIDGPRRSRTLTRVAIGVLLIVAIIAAAFWRGLVSVPDVVAQWVPQLPIHAARAPLANGPAEPPQPSIATAPAESKAPAETPATVEVPPAATVAAPSTTAQSEVPPQNADSAAVPVPATNASAKPSGSGPSRVSFDKDTYVVTESDGVARLVVKRSGSTRNAANFTWTLLSDSAVAGDDFAAIGPGTESIPAGSHSITLTIPLVSDAIKEPTELFQVEIKPADDNTQLGDQTRAAVIIVDDD